MEEVCCPKKLQFFGVGAFSPLPPKKHFSNSSKKILQKGPMSILMRLFTLISMVVLDFSQGPWIFGKLILFISVLKPFLEKSWHIFILYCYPRPIIFCLIKISRYLERHNIKICGSGPAKRQLQRPKNQLLKLT